MKFFALANLLAATMRMHTASAFQPIISTAATATTTTTSSLDMSSHHIVSDVSELSEVRNEPILKALGTLEGPSISYGHFAVLENKKPTDIKDYDNFDSFKAAIDQADCTKALRGNGPFTVLAPTNSAIEKYQGVLTEEVIMTHIIPKDIYSDEMEGTVETLSGHTVTFRKEFRKIYVDDAMIGQLDNHSGGTPYPTNVICENGVIHAINIVLEPGWTRCAGDSQGVQGLSLQSHLKQDVLKDRGALPDSASDRH